VSSCGAFGSGGFGAVPFGAASGIGISILVTQESLNSVLVDLTDVPVVPDILGPDPLDVSSWSLSLGSPVLSGAALPLVQAVEYVDGDTVRVLFDAPCTPGQVYVLTYLPAVDLPCGITAAASFLAFATPLTLGPIVAGLTQGRFDLANPQLQADAAGNVVALGTLQVDSTGDLALETGVPYLRKRVLRRLTTPVGAFLDLVGYGLAIPSKRNLRASEMIRLKVLAQQQIQQEPDVLSVSISVSNPRPGVVILFVRIETVAGLTDQFETTLGGR